MSFYFAKDTFDGVAVAEAFDPVVEGEVSIDKPVELEGQHVHGIYLRFEDGEVVEFDAKEHTDALEATLATDDGARRLGEFGIGMNQDIDRFTGDILFDEK